MSKLSERRTIAETKFNELVKQREQKQAELTDLDAELNRLQGEYRLLNELEEAELVPSENFKDLKARPDAATVDATKAEKK